MVLVPKRRIELTTRYYSFLEFFFFNNKSLIDHYPHAGAHKQRIVNEFPITYEKINKFEINEIQAHTLCHSLFINPISYH